MSQGRHGAIDDSEIGDLGHTSKLLRRHLADRRENGQHGVVHPDIDFAEPVRNPGSGRPLCDWGRRDEAKGLWRCNFAVLENEIRAGISHEILKSGCCGMAGSFGFEKDKYEVSQAAGKRVLLPRMRQASEDAPILANGFSCREQSEQNTGRSALHVVDLLASIVVPEQSR
jgi:hypothetical protein